MKIAVLLSIARQVEGEFVFCQVKKASVDPKNLYAYLSQNTLPRTDVIEGVECVIEYGIIEDIEVD